jgi:hypothetical protein
MLQLAAVYRPAQPFALLGQYLRSQRVNITHGSGIPKLAGRRHFIVARSERVALPY